MSGGYGWRNEKEQREHEEAEYRKALENIARREARERGECDERDQKLTEKVILNPHTGAVWKREFSGPKRLWMDQFKAPGVRIDRFITQGWD